ncbi:hypothetical protein L5515_016902 [Caenorhabditis briggsae]|uniref:Uncharacterized protein n=1 Tax=Caenorhabditis briggsae TaxID=6238 RepID=A0AAE9FCE9_CAEBR|nr:hypothetical protein L5515_016902 [Caenorhabditis briggsae]
MLGDSELSTSCYSISSSLGLYKESHNNHFIQPYIHHNQRVYSGNFDNRLAWQSSLKDYPSLPGTSHLQSVALHVFLAIGRLVYILFGSTRCKYHLYLTHI